MSEILWIVGALSMFSAGPSIGTIEYREEIGQINPDGDYDFYIALLDDYVGCEVRMYTPKGIFNGVVFDASGDAATSKWMDWKRYTDDGVVVANIAGEVNFGFGAENLDLIGEKVLLRVEDCRNGGA